MRYNKNSSIVFTTNTRKSKWYVFSVYLKYNKQKHLDFTQLILAVRRVYYYYSTYTYTLRSTEIRHAQILPSLTQSVNNLFFNNVYKVKKKKMENARMFRTQYRIVITGITYKPVKQDKTIYFHILIVMLHQHGSSTSD